MPSSLRTVCCLGASLTAGSVSANYIEMLEQRSMLRGFRFVNHGVNGHMAWNALQRLDQVIADKPDAVAILLGTNDVNATLSERNRVHYQKFYRMPVEHPDLAWFEENLREIVRRLQAETQARLALISLALIGENLEHEANRKIARYNESIRQIAAEAKIDYLPFHEQMLAYLKEHEAERASLPPRLEYRDGLVNISNATALHHQGLSWNEISRRNGLQLLTDGVHLNSIGAAMIADLMEEWLVKL